jgi:hypothetical protein
MKKLFQKILVVGIFALAQVIFLTAAPAQAVDSGILLRFVGDNSYTEQDFPPNTYPVFKFNVYDDHGSWRGTFKEYLTFPDFQHVHVLALSGTNILTFTVSNSVEETCVGVYENFVPSFPELSSYAANACIPGAYTEGCYVVITTVKNLVPDSNMSMSTTTGMMNNMTTLKGRVALLAQMVKVGDQLMPNIIKSLDSNLFLVK